MVASLPATAQAEFWLVRQSFRSRGYAFGGWLLTDAMRIAFDTT